MPKYELTIRAASKDADVTVQTRFVEAKNEARAIQHVTKTHITCERVTMDRAIELTKLGIVCEIASDQP